MSESNGKIHSGNKRRKKVVKVKEEITVAQPPQSGYFFSDTELTIASLLFLWAVLASAYVIVDTFFYNI